MQFCFEAVNGLRINLAKSSIFSINADENIEELANILGCKVEKVPSVYLGLPLGEKRWTVASGMGSVIGAIRSSLHGKK